MFQTQNDGPFGGLHLAQGGPSRRSVLQFFGLGAAAVGSASLLSACGGGPAASGTGEAQKFAIAAFPGDAYLLDTINLANGDYSKHQLDVPKHLTPQSGVQAYQLLVAGAVDAYASDTLLLMATHANSSKGKRPLLVGFRNVESTYGIVGSKDISWPGKDASFEEKMASLKGKRIGVTSVGSGGDLQLKLALELAGMQYSDVTALAVGPTAQAIPNLNASRIDANVTVQWTASRFIAQEAGANILLDFTDASVPELLRKQAVVAMGVREDMVLDHPEVVQNWIAAQSDGSQWIIDNKKAAADLLNTNGLGGKGQSIAEAYVEHYAADVAPKLKPSFKATKETVDTMAELALRFGSVKQGDITYEELVPEFARA